MTGCTKVSPGCAHCYIERTPAFRIAGRRFVDGATDLQLHADRLEQPLHWKKPRRVFVNSLSDLFHDDVPDDFIDQVFAVMALTPQHTYQVLTKRPQRMREYLHRDAPWRWTRYMAHIGGKSIDSWGREYAAHRLDNVWLGVSVENQHFADARIPLLLQTPAAVRFISAEPLLGPVDVRFWLKRPYQVDNRVHPSLDWVIVGGESGPGARPFDLAAARAIVQQCQAAGVACFVKQVGSNPFNVYVADRDGVFLGGAELPGIHDPKGGDPAEWPADLRVREYPV